MGEARGVVAYTRDTDLSSIEQFMQIQCALEEKKHTQILA